MDGVVLIGEADLGHIVAEPADRGGPGDQRRAGGQGGHPLLVDLLGRILVGVGVDLVHESQLILLIGPYGPLHRRGGVDVR